MNDIELKNKGNKYFAARKYDEAVRCYSEAISKKPGVSIYYTNRALCHLKTRRYDSVCQDCRAALEIDPVQVKAHFFLGQALLESQCYDECIRHFQRAQDLAKEQKVNYGDDIAALIRVARKRRFNLLEDARITQEIELQSYLNRLILEDRDRLLASCSRQGAGVKNTGSHRPLSHNNPSKNQLHQSQHAQHEQHELLLDKENRQPLLPHPSFSDEQQEQDSAESSDLEGRDGSGSCSAKLVTAHHPLSSPAEHSSGGSVRDGLTAAPGAGAAAANLAEPLLTPDIVVKRAEDYQMDLNTMFAKLDDRRRRREVPDYLCGKISFDILRDPVVTPSGITYDRKDIEEHLQRVGHFDPITRTNLAVDKLVPNLAMKEVVAAFLEENEWALDY